MFSGVATCGITDVVESASVSRGLTEPVPYSFRKAVRGPWKIMTAHPSPSSGLLGGFRGTLNINIDVHWHKWGETVGSTTLRSSCFPVLYALGAELAKYCGKVDVVIVI